MIVFLNGDFVSEDRATVSVFDRSFQYGDGLFETVSILNCAPFQWLAHMKRLTDTAGALRLHLPTPPGDLRSALDRLIDLNRLPDGVLRIAVSRGVGHRGYSPRGATHPLIVMSLHETPALGGDLPTPWRLVTSRHAVPREDRVSGWKTASRIAHVLARMEADDAGVEDALLLNSEGHVCETTCANVFWFESGRILTPPASEGLLPGITRSVVMELAPGCGLTPAVKPATLERLLNADGVMVTLSSLGVVPVESIDGRAISRVQHVRDVQLAYESALQRECPGPGG